MRILEEFWYGNIEPTEYDTSSNKEYKKLVELIFRNEEKLRATMTDVELDKDAYGGVPLMTFRGFRKKAFAYIEKRWEVEYVEQLGRGFRFVGEDCTVTALRDGYLGLFTIWNVYDYPNS